VLKKGRRESKACGRTGEPEGGTVEEEEKEEKRGRKEERTVPAPR